MPTPPPDAVDAVIAQWTAERPDLADDLGAMATIGRLGRIVAHLGRRIDEVAGRHRLDVGELDVLFALRRSGAPYELTPSVLARTMMLSPAGVTSRVDRLERDQLVERSLNPDDRRSFRVRLTDDGLAVADALVVDHLRMEVEVLAPLGDAERKQLDRALRTLLASLEPSPPS